MAESSSTRFHAGIAARSLGISSFGTLGVSLTIRRCRCGEYRSQVSKGTFVGKQDGNICEQPRDRGQNSQPTCCKCRNHASSVPHSQAQQTRQMTPLRKPFCTKIACMKKAMPLRLTRLWALALPSASESRPVIYALYVNKIQGELRHI